MAFLLRHVIDYATSGGKYKDVNEPTHFEKQLDIQKYLHKKSKGN